MKKTIFSSTILTLILAFLLVTSGVGAAGNATMSLSSSKTTYEVGDTFKVTINVNPGGQEMQTVRAELSFPSTKLEVTNFELNGLFPNQSPGITLNNVAGRISVGGYRLGDGVALSGKLGDLTFKAKSTGSASISFLAGSHIISPDQEEMINLSGCAGITLTIGAGEEEAPPAEEEGEAPPAEEEEEEEVAPVLLRPAVSSSTHPDQSKWYSADDVKLNWIKTVENLGYSLGLDHQPQTDPGPLVDTESPSYTYNNVDNGIWYFHVKTKYQEGWSPLTHFKIQIDTTKPGGFIPILETQTIEGKKKFFLSFAATDANSGIDYYEIKFNDNSYASATSPYQLTNEYLDSQEVTVKAVDKAGNFREALLDLTTSEIQELKEAVPYVEVTPVEPPIIKEAGTVSYSYSTLYKRKVLKFEGTSQPLVEISLYIQSTNTIGQTKADELGDWVYYLEQFLPEGDHSVYAIALLEGISSAPSDAFDFTISEDFIPEKKLKTSIKLSLLILLLLLIAVILVSWIKKGKRRKRRK